MENEWEYLSEPTKTILERIDINRKSAEVPIGHTISIPHFNGVLTEEIAKEFVEYQHSKENEGYFSASLEDDLLKINFIKQALNF